MLVEERVNVKGNSPRPDNDELARSPENRYYDCTGMNPHSRADWKGVLMSSESEGPGSQEPTDAPTSGAVPPPPPPPPPPSAAPPPPPPPGAAPPAPPPPPPPGGAPQSYAQQPYAQQPYGVEQKSKMVAGILGILLGGFGVHRFYLGYTSIGIIQIVVTIVTCGIGAIWGVIEGILILVGNDNFLTDANGVPLKE